MGRVAGGHLLGMEVCRASGCKVLVGEYLWEFRFEWEFGRTISLSVGLWRRMVDLR